MFYYLFIWRLVYENSLFLEIINQLKTSIIVEN